ncbi:MAG: cobalamin biosynthesis protein, partial [Pseudomonadota bacterium]
AAIDWPELKEKLDACLLPEHLAPNPEMLPDMPDPFPTWRRAEQAA